MSSLGRNTVLNLAGLGVPLVLFVIFVPIYVSLLGTQKYGVLSMVWVVLGLFGMLDLGLGRAVNQRIAREVDHPEERRRILASALAGNWLVAVIGAVLIAVAAFFVFGQTMRLSADLREESLQVVPLLACAVPVMTTLGVLSGALQGRESFLAVNRIAIANAVIFQTLPLLAIWVWGPHLPVVVAAALMARVFAVVSLWRECLSEFGKGFARGISWNVTRQLVSYGGWITVGGIVGMILVFSDRFVIGAVFGAAAVTIYAIPLDATRRLAVVADALGNAAFPKLAAADDKKSGDTVRKAMASLYAIATPLIAPFIVVAPIVSILWLGDDIGSRSASLMQILALAAWINIFAKPPQMALLAKGKSRLLALVSGIELMLFFPALLIAVRLQGLEGAAWIYLARNAVDTSIICLLAKVERRPIFLVAGSFLIILSILIAILMQPMEWFGRLLVGLLAVILSVWAAWHVAPLELKRLLINFGKIEEI